MFKKILKYFWLSIIVVFFLHCSSTLSRTPKARLSTAETLQQYTVALVGPREEDKAIPFCTGVWISKHHIITAAHCVEDDLSSPLSELFPKKATPIGNLVWYATFYDIQDKSKKSVHPDLLRKSEVLAFHKKVDLALLYVNEPPEHGWANIKKGHIHVGTNIHIVGHVVQWWWTYYRGYISMFRNIKGPFESPIQVIQVQSSAWKGVSGGGLFNDDGQLLGIMSFIDPNAPELNFFIHRDQIILMLKSENLI